MCDPFFTPATVKPLIALCINHQHLKVIYLCPGEEGKTTGIMKDSYFISGGRQKCYNLKSEEPANNITSNLRTHGRKKCDKKAALTKH